MKRDLKALISQMTLEEKAGLCSGLDFWHLKGIERLGIPSVMVSDGPHGLRKQEEKGDHLGINDSIKAVCFPPAVLSACSFDRALMHQFGDAIGKEAQANNLSVVLGPGVNIKRSPICGRNFEYYSEDPYLAGETAAAFINGVQEHHVGTSLKHFAGNNQEYNRMSCSSNIDERTLREIYLSAFETAVKKAQPYTVMCSYNRINGTFSSENPWLLTDVLRGEWGFKGYVMSDWGAVNERVPGLKAGLELEMPSSNGINDKEIIKAVQNGTLEESVLDLAVERLLHIIFEYTDHREEQEFALEADHELAARIAEESMVLLKNESVLPLGKDEKIAFIGEFAAKPRYQGGGSSHINSFRVSSILDELKDNANITYVKGFAADGDIYEETLAAEAIEAAKKADKAVIFAGLPDSFESEGYDRAHMKLPRCQNRLIGEILKVQPETVVVLHNGSPVEMPWLSDVKGLLEAYLGGQAIGKALANILFGKTNPSGKLAETMPYKLSDNPSYLCFGDGENVDYREGIFVGYRYYDAKEMPVAFPFGYGLSYTSFSYSNLKVDKEKMQDTDTLTVTVDVTNTGSREGKEIVQLYVSDLTRSARRPVKELKGYDKLSLKPGETKTASFTLGYRSFAWYSTDIHDWYAAAGDYEILIGASSRDIRLTKKVCLMTDKMLPLKIHMNTTLGELLSDPRTKQYALEFKKRLDAFFGAPADKTAGNETAAPESAGQEKSATASEAISDDMDAAIAASMPLRNVVTFGLYQKEEIMEIIEKINTRIP